jgi:superfamily I DNA/RNA helicase
LTNAGIVDPAEFVRIAYRLRRKGEEPLNSYSAVIVDEVQDISEIGLRLLHGLVGEAPDGLLLVGDGTQRIFTRGYAMRGLGIEVAGRSIILRKNFRNTKQILQAAFPLVAKEWRSEVQADGADWVDPDSVNPVFSVREGSRPAIVRCNSPSDEGTFIKREVAYLLKYEKYSPGDICVMARNAFYRQLVYDALAQAGIPVIHYQAESEAEAPASQVKVSSLHSAKGHEYAAVLIPGMVEAVFPQSNITDIEEVDRERAILYVGMTRARDILYLSYSQCGERGQPIAPSRFLDEIASGCELLAFSG